MYELIGYVQGGALNLSMYVNVLAVLWRHFTRTTLEPCPGSCGWCQAADGIWLWISIGRVRGYGDGDER
ncbi:hypothetical protein [Allokutzneria albata]|uniref:Uncharacterized protein n=1 Tax=Allokutzneria albata TaxID=211114 RepID=A0A1G9YAD6_ALLAB|nr:hypothetical protein [Allokutzneria albata]SDN06109.1 hypothetical protein SAMN04489726_4702 [Allokutzneria albata]